MQVQRGSWGLEKQTDFFSFWGVGKLSRKTQGSWNCWKSTKLWKETSVQIQDLQQVVWGDFWTINIGLWKNARGFSWIKHDKTTFKLCRSRISQVHQTRVPTIVGATMTGFEKKSLSIPRLIPITKSHSAILFVYPLFFSPICRGSYCSWAILTVCTSVDFRTYLSDTRPLFEEPFEDAAGWFRQNPMTRFFSRCNDQLVVGSLPSQFCLVLVAAAAVGNSVRKPIGKKQPAGNLSKSCQTI